MNKHIAFLAVLATTTLLGGTTASALTIEIVPSATTINVGQAFTVDLVAGLNTNEIVAAYDLNIGESVSGTISATDVTFGNALGGDLAISGFKIDSTPIELSEVSLMNDADLAILQPAPGNLTLATLHFTAIASGTVTLSFENYGLNGIDVKGANNVPYGLPALGQTQITVVPLPAALGLFASALLTLSGVSRRRSKLLVDPCAR